MTEKPNKTRPALLIAVLVVASLLACACLTVALLGRAGDAQDPAPTKPLPEVPATATRAPEATATPLPPTSTPKPTTMPTATLPPATSTPEPTEPPATRTPKPTATPDQSAGVRRYADEVGPIARAYGVALEGIAAQSNALAANPQLVYNDAWLTETAVNLALMRLLGVQMRAAPCPLEVDNVCAELEAGTLHYDRFTELYAQALDAIDGDLMTAAAVEMAAGNAAILRATALLTEMVE